MMSPRRSIAFALLAVIFFPASVRADVTPAALFGDHMVIQQGRPVPVWGWADPGEQITVTLGEAKATATADADGKWMARLTAQQAGGPVELTIAGKNTIAIKDVLLGEVWIATGQSNMSFTVSKNVARYAGLLDEEKEIAAADYPRIRMFTVKDNKTYEPRDKAVGDWQVCSPRTVPAFSAVGYLFARDLQKAIDVPVGIVTVAYGGSTAESWISREAMAADPQLKPMLDGFDKAVAFYRANPTAPGADAPLPPHTINSRNSGPPARQRNPAQDNHNPTVLFNGMLNPVIPYAMRGAIWYQGESIVGGTPGVMLYPHVMEALVKDWRGRWGEGDFPFYAVQLAPQQNVSNNPLVREGQARILDLPNTGLATTIDIGEARNVHPHDKAPLGDRLARLALANVYGRQVEDYGPLYDSMTVQGDAIRVKFTHVGGGLVAKDGPLKWFQIAGADRNFVDADARIDGDSVVVSSPQVKAPVAVRYAWDNYPDGCNLWNEAGLPAPPFRSDDWEFKLVGIVE